MDSLDKLAGKIELLLVERKMATLYTNKAKLTGVTGIDKLVVATLAPPNFVRSEGIPAAWALIDSTD